MRTEKVIALAEEILKPCGGLLFEGYRPVRGLELGEQFSLNADRAPQLKASVMRLSLDRT